MYIYIYIYNTFIYSCRPFNWNKIQLSMRHDYQANVEPTNDNW